MPDDFEADLRIPAPASELILDLDGFEGPIDVLLALARRQKVDLARLSILALAEQYLAFIAQARMLRLELAADYLMMAAWLAYLKSRLLLPEREADDEAPSGEEMAEGLALHLARLEAMREAAARLMGRPLLGREVLARGAPEAHPVEEKPVYRIVLRDLLGAYADQRRRQAPPPLDLEPPEIHTMEAALRRLAAAIGGSFDWRTLASFLPNHPGDGLVWRSAIAATFAASLELAREGRVQIRQAAAFAPLYLRGSR